MRSIAELTRAYGADELRPTGVTAAALAAARAQAALGGFIYVAAEQATTDAEASSARWRAGRPRSPLDGVPVTIKDLFDVAGMPTSAGTARAVPAVADAALVAELRAAGAVLLGKTNMSELALSPVGLNPHHGAARNPVDPARDSGGSSSGAAVTVAGGVAPLALGSDLGGSVRIPAALCGVAALKPTFGALSTRGMLSVSPTLDHAGLIGATVGDLAAAWAVLRGELGARAAHDGAPPRFAVSDEWWSQAGRAEADTAWAALRRLADGLGGAVARAALPAPARAYAIGSVITCKEAASGPWLKWPLGPATRITMAVGARIRDGELARAEAARQALRRELCALLDGVDFVASPTTPEVASRYHDDGLRDGEIDDRQFAARVAYTYVANLAGLPAIQVPCGTAYGLPVGLQLIGAPGAEARLLEVAAAAEQLWSNGHARGVASHGAPGDRGHRS